MQKTILICNNKRANPNQPSCAQRGSEQISNALAQWINEYQVPLQIQHFKCLGQCEHGPNIKLLEGGFIQQINPQALDEVKAILLDFASPPK